MNSGVDGVGISWTTLASERGSEPPSEAARGIDGGAVLGGDDEDDAFARLDELPPLSADEAPGDESRADAAPAPRAASLARSKRKNFSKHLQFLSLRKYADHAQSHGRLPERGECELLLEQSFAEFVADGGSDQHPRLTYADFLKLIRNRSREQRQASSAMEPVRAAREELRRTRKRARESEYEAKIAELVRIIDRARTSRRPAPSSPDDILDTILQLQEETQNVQQQIQERLDSLRDRYRAQEPPSASV